LAGRNAIAPHPTGAEEHLGVGDRGGGKLRRGGGGEGGEGGVGAFLPKSNFGVGFVTAALRLGRGEERGITEERKRCKHTEDRKEELRGDGWRDGWMHGERERGS